MSLYKGTKRVASGGIGYTLTDDISSHSTTFVDDGDYSSYTTFDDLQAEITSGSQLAKLFSIVKKGLNFLNNKFSEYLPLTGGTLSGNLAIKKNTPTFVAKNSTLNKMGVWNMFENGTMQISSSDADAENNGNWSDTDTVSLLIYPASAQSNINNAIRMQRDGVVYNMYGAHNAYSAAEIDNKNKKLMPCTTYSDNTNGFASLKDFVAYTDNTDNSPNLGGYLKFKDVNGILGINAGSWFRVWYSYQNVYTSTYNVAGMLMIARDGTSTMYLRYISGTASSGYTISTGSWA